MNLENLNLVELNAQEVQEVEGGDFFITYEPSFYSFCYRSLQWIPKS